ncbi:MAG: RNA polymerase sigma-70 factor (ECF subfamily) [Halieaceae bacterium]
MRNDADADDACQEAAIRVYTKLTQFEGRSSLRAWIGAIVAHECINVIRKNQRRKIPESTAEQVRLHFHLLQDVESGRDILEAESCAKILQDLHTIPREVLRLRFYGDLSLEGISTVMNTSLSATKMRLYRALDQFKQAYRDAVSLSGDKEIATCRYV